MNLLFLGGIEARISAADAAVDERQRSRLFLRAIEASNNGIVIADAQKPGLPIVFANPAFERITGYRSDEVIGMNCRFLQGNSVDQPGVRAIRIALKNRTECRALVRNYRKDGSPFWNDLHIAPVFGTKGVLTHFVGVQSDVTAWRDAEEALRRSEEQMASALREKEVLLKENHHRVKNNMQVISSLFNLQMNGVTDERVRSGFVDAQNRISAMALVHEKLYHSSDLARVSFSDYIPDLAANIVSVLGAEARLIEFTVQAADVRLGIDAAIPCGLLINELVSNAFKHGFPDGRRGWVRVVMETAGQGRVRLEVADNGCGVPPSIDLREMKSLGMQLVHTLVNQLRGTIEVHREAGTRFVIEFAEEAQAL